MFLNGLPIAVLELKNAANENASIRNAYKQLQTYKEQIKTLFRYNQILVISDGLQARAGSLTANWEWFKVWRTIDGEAEAPPTSLELEVLIRGLFDRRRLLAMTRNFIAYEQDEKGRTTKLLAGYHQFHAVNKAVEQTIRASHGTGDRRAGVVWHTQGSGKSLSMLFYAGRISRDAAMANPTVVVLTDRNDLDDQLFGQFNRCSDVLGQKPKQAGGRAELRSLLQVASGGVVFTTIQKFMPEERGDRMPCLSDRRNIVVIADEAHRSQYESSACRGIRFDRDHWPSFASDFIRYEHMLLAARDQLFKTHGGAFTCERQHRLLLDGLVASTDSINRATATTLGWAVSWLGPSQALAPSTGFTAPALGLTVWLANLPHRRRHISIKAWHQQVAQWLAEDLTSSLCMWGDITEFMSTRGRYLLYGEAVRPMSLAIQHRASID